MEEEIDLLDLFYAFWQKKLWLILSIVIGAILGYVYTEFIVVPKYSSSVTLILAKANSGNTQSQDLEDAITQSDITLNQKLISTYSEIIKSKRVGNTVIQKLNLDISYKELKNSISVSSVKDTDVIKVSVTTPDASISQKIATELVVAFTDEVDRVYNIQNVSIIDDAEIDNTPVNINYSKNIAIFAVALFAVASAVIFLFYYFDTTIKNEDTIRKITGLPVLCSIPKLDKKEVRKQ